MEESGAVLLVATMDTKSGEVLYIKECFKEFDVPFLTLDAGIMGVSPLPVTVTREEVALAGGMTLADVQNLGSEGEALGVMTQGAIHWAKNLYRKGRIKGIMGIGGSMGTALGTAVMRTFPVGFPKVMISTMASRNTRPYVGTKDILMIHSVCDLSGINRITGKIIRNGALAMAGMVKDPDIFSWHAKPPVALSTLGTTDKCAQVLKQELEKKGKEVIVFHTIGSGGEAMEEFIRDEDVEIVIDLSLHELVDHYFGGDGDAGADRGLAALKKGVPTILVPGNIDFIVAGPFNSAKERFPGRLYHVHNAANTAIRTRKREIEFVAGKLAEYFVQANGPVSVIIPMKGFSAWDIEGSPFYNPDAVHVFVKTVQNGLPSGIALHLLPYHINDPEFAHAILEVQQAMVK